MRVNVEEEKWSSARALKATLWSLTLWLVFLNLINVLFTINNQYSVYYIQLHTATQHKLLCSGQQLNNETLTTIVVLCSVKEYQW